MKVTCRICLILVFAILLGMFTACSSSNISTASTSATQAVATTAATEAVTTVASTTAASATTTTAASATTTTTAPAIDEERVTISVTSVGTGVQVPDNLDLSDNPKINIAKEYANCDVDFSCIPWTDYQTQLNLLLASGKYPDIFVTYFNDNVIDVERRGAFIDLLEYFENSEIVQSRIDHDDFIEQMRDAVTGGYYALPTPSQGPGYPEGGWAEARWDLLVKYNNSEWPKTVDEWVDVARLVKEGNPNANPFSAQCPGNAIFQWGAQFWFAYGVNPNMEIVRQENGTYLFNVEDSDYVAAMEFHRKLYEEKLLSQTFATNTDRQQIQNDRDNNDLLLWNTTCDNMYMPTLDENGELPTQQWICAPLLEEYPVDFEKAMEKNQGYSSFVSTMRTHISTSCKYPDRAWRLLEGFCTDEFYDAVFWGVEGVTYKVNDNGEKYIDESTIEAWADPSNRFAYGRYAFLLGPNNQRIAALFTQKMSTTPEIYDMELSNMAQWQENASHPPFISMDDLISDETFLKRDEAQGIISTLCVKYIMGRITMDEWDTEIGKFLDTYRYMTDDYTAAYKTRYIDKVG